MRVVWIGAVCVLASGCTSIRDSIEEEARRRANAEAQPGDEPGDPPPINDDTMQLNSVQPNRGLNSGGTAVEIVGVGFPADVNVFFNGVPALGVLWLSENRIQCVTPPFGSEVDGRRPVGWVNVLVEDSEDVAAELPTSFEYYERVTATSLLPGRGPVYGGTLVTLRGTGFVAGTSVRFGDLATVTGELNLVDGQPDRTTLTLVTPALPHALYNITVSNLNGSASLASAFWPFDPLHVRAVIPFAGPTTGGTNVGVQGTGFITPTNVALGEQTLAGTSSTNENSVTVTTGARADTSNEGKVDVTATHESDSSTLHDGFIFYDPNNPTARIVGITPAAGIIEGGTTVNIVGTGFAAEPTTVTIGGSEADCSILDDHMITCTVPAGDEGPTSLRVVNAGMDESVDFTYLDLHVDLVLSAEGAIAGGTYVTLFGGGFPETDMQVFFDGLPARDLTWIDETSVTLRTPRGSVGAADVKVAVLGIELSGGELYTYFDPGNYDQWSAGGPIDGAINVTVINGNDPVQGDGVNEANRPVQGAYVMLGDEIDPLRPWTHGTTDERGQIVLSGPEIIGAHTLHAGKAGYGSFTWGRIDARNLTLVIMKHPPPEPNPLPECPPPSGGGMDDPEGRRRPLVRGTVYRIKDEFNTGDDTVLVTTTYTELGSILPDPGPGVQLVSQGPYQIYTRTGDMVVIAKAGYVSGGELDVHAIGLRPFVYTEASSGLDCEDNSGCDSEEQCIYYEEDDQSGICRKVYDGVDVIIDTPLNRPMRVTMDNPPLDLPMLTGWSPPDLTYAIVYYDFGFMGVLPMGLEVGTGDTFFFDMPKGLTGELAGTPFQIETDAVGSTFGDETRSSTRAMGLTDTRIDHLMTPMLRVFHELTPNLLDFMEYPFDIELEQLPLDETIPPPSVNVHYMYDVWYPNICQKNGMPMQSMFPEIVYRWLVLSPGDANSIALPDWPDAAQGASLPPGPHNWYFLGYYATSIDVENFDMLQTFEWTSQTLRFTGYCVDTCSEQPMP